MDHVVFTRRDWTFYYPPPPLFSQFERIVNPFERNINPFERVINSFERIIHSFERIINSFERISGGKVFFYNDPLGAPYKSEWQEIQLWAHWLTAWSKNRIVHGSLLKFVWMIISWTKNIINSFKRISGGFFFSFLQCPLRGSVLLQVNCDKMMHVPWDFDASNSKAPWVPTVNFISISPKLSRLLRPYNWKEESKPYE